MIGRTELIALKILFGLLGIMIFILGILQITLMTEMFFGDPQTYPTSTQIFCYDKYGNEMQDQVCYKRETCSDWGWLYPKCGERR